MSEEILATVRARIEGKRIVSIAGGGSKLLLNDGTVLNLYQSDSDCCAYAEGSWVIQPDDLEAIITDVTFGKIGARQDSEVENGVRITILHNQNPVALADCYAGHNGYYFSVLSLNIAVPDADPLDVKVVEA